MKKMCRWCLLVGVFIVAGQVPSLNALNAQDFVKSNRVTTLDDTRKMATHHRSRRAVTLSEVEKTEIVDKHNALRRLQGASNMEHMVSVKQHIVLRHIPCLMRPNDGLCSRQHHRHKHMYNTIILLSTMTTVQYDAIHYLHIVIILW